MKNENRKISLINASTIVDEIHPWHDARRHVSRHQEKIQEKILHGDMDMKLSILSFIFFLLSASAFTAPSPTKSRTQLTVRAGTSTNLFAKSESVVVNDKSFHTDDDYTTDQMEKDLRDSLPDTIQLSIESSGSIAKVAVTFPATKWAKGHHLTFSTFVDRSHIEDLKTNIMRKYDENMADDL